MLQLKVTAGPDKGKILELEPGKTYTIGNDEGSSLTLTDPLVLKGHCSFEVGARGGVVRNHTASAGTFVEDEKVSQAQIGPNSAFRIGETTLTLVRIATTSAGAPDVLVGKILGGYKLKEVVGEGGMGKVFRATQLSLHRDVAVKVLRDQLARDKSFRDLFINEARAAAQLVHPNIVQVFDGKTEGDTTFFSMEFIGQGSVEEILARDGKIPWEEAILMVLEAAHGLEYAEGKGIVHRDIKPDNLMINDDGQVKIADLGLAKRGEGSQQKGIIGTPHFIPPEQALGKEVDHRADIYSLGATFFRMITGKTLFTGKTAKEIVLKHIKEPAPAASSGEPSVPDDLDLVISKMLAKEPDGRYQSATDLIRALEEVCAHHGIKGSIIKKGVGKRVLIPVVVLLLGAVGAAIHFGMQDPVEVESPEKTRERLEAQARAARETKQRREAEKKTRRTQADSRWREFKTKRLELSINEPIESVYDDEDAKVTAARELKWEDLAQQYDEFAKHALATEFDGESQYVTKAGEAAEKIRSDLKKLKESAEDKREKIALMVKKATDINKKQEEALADMRLKRNYERAANLCEVIETGDPRALDPFKAVVTWLWVSPVDKDVRQAATKIPKIMKIVDEARRDFEKERKELLKEARKVAELELAQADALAETAGDAEYTKVIEALDDVAKSFLDPDARKPISKLRQLVRDVAKKRDALAKALAKKQAARKAEDQILVRNKQRKMTSLDPEQLPNLVMKCEFDDAINAWNQLLETKEVKTELYDAFVRERIQMARWCKYLFARFRHDFNNGELSSKSLGNIAFGAARPAKNVSLKAIPEPYSITLNKRYEGKTKLRLANLPMDWIYHRLLLHENEPRWKKTPAVVHFALGVFCFETMQYKESKRHFNDVLKINGAEAERYAAVAKSLLARAEREQAAREEWETLCAGVQAVATSKELADLKTRILGFGKEHEGTLFFLEVMNNRAPITRDFFDAAWPAIPKAPPPPLD